MRAQNASPGEGNGIKTGAGGARKINLETLPGHSRKFNVETLIYVSS